LKSAVENPLPRLFMPLEGNMLKEYRFQDKDVQGVTMDEHNHLAGNVELLLKENVEAILIYKDDVIELAKHFGIIEA
jgi:hypothetical protein